MLDKYITLAHLGRQFREELWELNDDTTRHLVINARKGNKKHAISFKEWMKKYAD